MSLNAVSDELKETKDELKDIGSDIKELVRNKEADHKRIEDRIHRHEQWHLGNPKGRGR
jgi:hypothetical protein